MSGEEERNVEAEEAPERIARARADEPLPEELPVLPLRNTVLFPSWSRRWSPPPSGPSGSSTTRSRATA